MVRAASGAPAPVCKTPASSTVKRCVRAIRRDEPHERESGTGQTGVGLAVQLGGDRRQPLVEIAARGDGERRGRARGGTNASSTTTAFRLQPRAASTAPWPIFQEPPILILIDQSLKTVRPSGRREPRCIVRCHIHWPTSSLVALSERNDSPGSFQEGQSASKSLPGVTCSLLSTLTGDDAVFRSRRRSGRRGARGDTVFGPTVLVDIKATASPQWAAEDWPVHRSTRVPPPCVS